MEPRESRIKEAKGKKPKKVVRKRKLNDRQIAYARNLVSGMTQHEAYVKAGYKVASTKIAEVNAAKLLGDPRVRQYVNVLRDFQDRKALKTASEKRLMLSEMMDNTRNTTIDRQRAIVIDNKMAGHDAPQVVEIKGSLIDQLRGE